MKERAMKRAMAKERAREQVRVNAQIAKVLARMPKETCANLATVPVIASPAKEKEKTVVESRAKTVTVTLRPPSILTSCGSPRRKVTVELEWVTKQP